MPRIAHVLTSARSSHSSRSTVPGSRPSRRAHSVSSADAATWACTPQSPGRDVEQRGGRRALGEALAARAPGEDGVPGQRGHRPEPNERAAHRRRARPGIPIPCRPRRKTSRARSRAPRRRSSGTYAKTLDSAHETYDSEERAHRTAFSAVKHVAEKKGDHWELKDEKGPSDPQAAKRGAAARDRPAKTYGGVDASKSEVGALRGRQGGGHRGALEDEQGGAGGGAAQAQRPRDRPRAALVRRAPFPAASPSSRSTSTQSRHSPSRRAWRRWTPTSVKPAARCSARLAALLAKIREVSLW